jgi:hypothetical protein
MLFGARFMTTVGLYTKNRTSTSSLILGGAAALYLLLAFALVPGWGMLGAAWATLITFAVLFAANLWANLRAFWIPYEYGRLLKVCAAWLGLYAASLLAATGWLWADLLIKLLLLAGLPLALAALRFYTPAEWAAIRQAPRALRAAWQARRARRSLEMKPGPNVKGPGE